MSCNGKNCINVSELLSVPQAAQIASVTVLSVRNWVKGSGCQTPLASYRVANRDLILRSDLFAFLDEREDRKGNSLQEK